MNQNTPTDNWVCPNPDCEWSNPETVGVCNNCGCPKNHKEILERLATPTDNAWLDELLEAYRNTHSVSHHVLYHTKEEQQQMRDDADKWCKQAILTHIDTVCREAELKTINMALACKDEGWGDERDYLEHRLTQLNPNKDTDNE